jgi:hypothetical protein
MTERKPTRVMARVVPRRSRRVDVRHRATFAGLVISAWAVLASGAVPSAPDYGKPESWAAFPGRNSGALVPITGATPAVTAPSADVFFVHPTTYLSIGVDNAAFDAQGPASRMVDVLRNQASVFNACCRIYAPGTVWRRDTTIPTGASGI